MNSIKHEKNKCFEITVSKVRTSIVILNIYINVTHTFNSIQVHFGFSENLNTENCPVRQF